MDRTGDRGRAHLTDGRPEGAVARLAGALPSLVDPTPPTRDERQPGPGGAIAFAVVAAIAAIVLWRAGRELTFFFDEWNVITDRRSGLSTLLEPHNGHVSVVPFLVYRVLFATAGLESYTPYLLAVVGLHLLCATLFFVYAARRVPTELAVILAALLLFIGSAWQDLLWAFQIGFIGSMAAAMVVFLGLDRGDRRGDVMASAGLLVALGSSGLGVPVAFGATVEVLLRPDRLRRIWLLVPPGLAYVIWFLSYGESQADGDNLRDVPSFVATAFAGALRGLVGADLAWGRWLAGALAALVVVHLVDRGRITVRLAAVSASAAGLWFLTGLSRADEVQPDESRYLYPGGLFVLLVVVELLRGRRVPRPVLAAVVVVALLAVDANLEALDDGRDGLEQVAVVVRPQLTAVEIAADVVPRDYRPDTARMPQVAAGPYLEAVDELGSPALSEDELLDAPDGLRAAADRVLVEAHQLVLVPVDEPAAQSCRQVTADGAGISRVDLPVGGAVVSAGTADAELTLRRFSNGADLAPLGVIPAGSTAILRIEADRSEQPWSVTAPAESLTVCPIGTG